jgi:hypothetical protein
MAGRLGYLTVLVLAALPLAARADGVDLTIPDHYVAARSGQGAQLPPVFRVWDRRIDGVRHSIVASAAPAGADLNAVVDADLAGVKRRNGVDITRADGDPLCGAPSVKVTYAYANQLTYAYRYTVVGGRLLIASYAHPVGTAPDPGALAALDTLCSGVHQAMGPADWVLLPGFLPNGGAWMAPTFTSNIIEVASPAAPGDAPYEYKGKATVTSDRQEQCGTVTIRRVTATSTTPVPLTVDFVSGIVRGYNYANEYSHPTAAPPNPAVLAVLTSFCTETAPAVTLPSTTRT